MTLKQAMELFEEGKLARQKCYIFSPYKKNTSKFFWWGKGWLEKHHEMLQMQ